MSNGTELAKKGFVIAIALLLIILMIPIVQGCSLPKGCAGYIDPEGMRELISRDLELRSKYDKLCEERDKQRSTMEAMQSQTNNLEEAIGVAQGDVASAEEEVEDSQQEIEDKQQEIKDKQAEIAATEQKMEEVAQEIEAIEAPFREWTPWCFACDTLVLMADNSLKRISDVQVGDMVQAYDVETGQTVTAGVTATNNGEADYYYLINGNLKVTPPHPFFTAEGKWVKIADLKVGDKVRSLQGVVEITSIEKVHSGQQICNISVRDFHNFFVSANGKDFYLVQE